jgi:hypoxanthine phosphoribosyltransferase
MNGNNGIFKKELRRTWVRVFAIVSVVFLFVKIFTQYIPSQYFWYTILCIMILFLTSFSISLYVEGKRVRDQKPWPRNELLVKRILSYVDVEYSIDELIKDIRGFSPDIIIGIDRGGAIVGGMLAKYLERPLTTMSSSIAWTISDPLSSLDDGVKHLGKQRTEKYNNKKILLVDDVCRGGGTLKRAYKVLDEKCNFELQTAVILNEKREVGPSKVFMPNFFVYETERLNVRMPWDKAHVLA